MRARASPRLARASRAPRATLPELDARDDARPLRPRHVVANEIIVVDDALTPRDCARIVDAIGDAFAPATSGARRGEARRRNGRFAETSEAFARRLFERARVARTFAFEMDDAAGLNPNVRVYRYREGERFGAHVDERVTALGRRSKYTALYYLGGEDLEGGATIFYDEFGDERCRVRPKIGRALYFRHGADMPEHEGEEVRRGTKYVLRSDVLF